jgi:KDO2-lipid IV(A) lauroyltransferase
MQQDTLTVGQSYSSRPSFFARERSYKIAPDAIEWRSGADQGRINYASVKEVRFYRTFMRGGRTANRKTVWFCRIDCYSGESAIISPLHYVRFRTWEDRSLQFAYFVRPLIAELRRSNPTLEVASGRHWNVKLNRLAASTGSSLLVRLVNVIRASNRENIAEVTSYFTRKIGPLLRAHRVGRANLAVSFPEKSPREIEQILRGVWENVGRLPVEFAFIDRLWDYDLDKRSGHRIVVDAAAAERIKMLRDNGGPALCFGAHLANWEMPALAAAALGLKSAMIYRPPNSKTLADEILRLREPVMGNLIPAGPGAALKIQRALRQGCVVGMLADQHTARGVDVEFFGRPCKVSSTIGRLARQFDCPIYGARSIRLPAGRFAFELTEAIEAPRDAKGKIDVAATMQMITLVIEDWVRDHPDQWLWLHRRWR